MSINVGWVPEPQRIVHETKADFSGKQVSYKQIHVVQYDRSLPIIAVQLYENGNLYTIPTNATIKIRWGKKDRTYVYKDVLGCDSERHIVYFDIDEQMSIFDGLHKPILEVIVNGKSAGSTEIPIMVDRNPVQMDDIMSDSPYPFAQVAVTGNFYDLNNIPETLETIKLVDSLPYTFSEIDLKLLYRVNGATVDNLYVVNKIVESGHTSYVAKLIATQEWVSQQGYLTSVSWADIINKPTFATVATSGSYNDLVDKPTIPAAQVNSDWNATEGVAKILNKPTLGSAASKNVGTSAGNIPILDSNGKLVESVIPAVAITDTYVVTSESEMLALNAQKGDIAIRSDLNKSFVLQSTPASILSNWKVLLTPIDSVLSVNGKTGSVMLNASDVGVVVTSTSVTDGINTFTLPSNYVTTDTEQTITSKKTFATDVLLGSSTTAGLGKIIFLNPELSNQGDWYIDSPDQNGIRFMQKTQNTGIKISRGIMYPLTSAYFTLGNNNYRWKTLFLSHYVDFGNNSMISKNSSHKIEITANNTLAARFANTQIEANVDVIPTGPGRNLGSNSNMWQHLFLSGNLSDGTNTMTIAQIATQDWVMENAGINVTDLRSI